MMQTTKAFSLIDLLVVIALISILAAVLFPVIVKSQEKDTQQTDASNMRQIALGVLMYASDHDGNLPFGTLYGTDQNWTTEIRPYIHDSKVFCNEQGAAGCGAWVGKYGSRMTVGVNAFEYSDPVRHGWGMARLGCFTDLKYVNAPNNLASHGDVNNPVCNMFEFTDSASTIMLADLYGSDTKKITKKYFDGVGNVSKIGGTSFIGTYCDGWDYDPSMTMENPKTVADNNPLVLPGNARGANYGGYWQLPDPDRSSSLAYTYGDDHFVFKKKANEIGEYPYGVNGIVSAPFANHTMTNFAYADGHVECRTPASTNPDGCIARMSSISPWDFKWDANNQWLVVKE